MHLQLLSIHGLVRGDQVEMGRDADTGGQVRYVVELCKALGEHPAVTAVDLITRQINEPSLSSDYAQAVETLSAKCRLIRLPCGGNRYIRKEELWPYLDQFHDELLKFNSQENSVPDFIHAHYADAAYIASKVAATWDIPFLFTAHSLGKPKLETLFQQGWSRKQAIDEFHLDQRILAEEDCLQTADLIFTSTAHERDNLYADYPLPFKLEFDVIPPGINLNKFQPRIQYSENRLVQHKPVLNLSSSSVVQQTWTNELNRFLVDQNKPFILSIARPDKNKNLTALIKAYGSSDELQDMANLVILAGQRGNISQMQQQEKEVLTHILQLQDQYDLYGKMAIPKTHNPETDVPVLYRIAAGKRGIFVNTSRVELFGITLLEASASGLPFIATHNGGPRDIVDKCRSGLLVDVTNQKQLINKMKHLLSDRRLWSQLSRNGQQEARNSYSWKTHCDQYITTLKNISTPKRRRTVPMTTCIHNRLKRAKHLLITDIDNTLLGDERALEELKFVLKQHRDDLAFGFATGRSLKMALEILEQHNISDFDLAISSVGTEIYYGSDLIPDLGWRDRLEQGWHPEKVCEVLSSLKFIKKQPHPQAQRPYKISYDFDHSLPEQEALNIVRERLFESGSNFNLIFSHQSYLDILPANASKGDAIRHIHHTWDRPIESFITAGDSGNDTDMLTGLCKGIVVANYSQELEALKNLAHQQIYFASKDYAAGILEGLEYWGIINSAEDCANPEHEPKEEAAPHFLSSASHKP